MNSILHKTFDQMPNVFTSNFFNATAVKNGYPKSLLKHNGLAHFLHLYSTNDKVNTKTWTKNDTTIVTKNKKEHYIFNNEQEIIEFLKSKGFKIMKPVSEWVEL